LVRELPDIMSGLRSSASVTIGVNLDQFLRPVEATLLSVNQKKFTRQSLMNRLFNQGEFSGIAPLHEVPRRQVEGRYAFSVDPELGRAVDPLMVPLFKDLSDVLEKTTKPIAEHLKQYNRLRSRIFVNLRQDLIFYLGVLNFIGRMRTSGLPVCRPETADMEERSCSLQDMYNPNLALNLSGSGDPPRDLTQEVVRNDVEMGAHGRIHILTGPNRGGKTTFMQGLALIQVMFQCGMYVPAAAARISPVDQVYTHFPIEERLSNNTGRFGDEARRLAAIFQQVTRFSLVLLNESFTSTSVGESQYLAEDVLRIFKRVGARVIFSTHMHDLAGRVEELNQSPYGDSQIVSLVSSPVEDGPAGDGIRRSYKILRRPPMGRSYAREIAERYGIGYEQLEELLTGRGVFKHEPPDAVS
jgi:DNA mismatch repair ATPase MutS